MAYPLFTTIEKPIYDSITTISDGLLNGLQKSTAASNLTAWVRIISGVGNGLVLFSNPDMPVTANPGTPIFDSNNKIIGYNYIASLYGNGTTAAQVGIDWSGRPVFGKANETLGELVLRPHPIITGLSVKEGKDQISRVCELTIKCFSLSQAERLQEYVMEPGYTLCVEWGLNTEKGLSQLINTSKGEGMVQDITAKNLDYNNLHRVRVAADGDYDSFLGFIVGGSFTSADNDSYTLTIKLRGMPGLPTFLQLQYPILELRTTYDASGKKIGTQVRDTPATQTYSAADVSITTGDVNETLGLRRAKWLYNNLPSSKQIPEVKTNIIEEAGNRKNNLGWFNFINFDYVVKSTIKSHFESTSAEINIAGFKVPKEKFISNNQYINLGYAIKILNANNGLISYKYNGKNVKCRINPRSFIGAFPKMFSTRPSKLLIPGKMPDFYKLYCTTETVSYRDLINSEIDNSINADMWVVDSATGKETVKQGWMSFVQYEEIPPASVKKSSYNGFFELPGYYGKLEHLYVNYEVFKNAIINSNNKSIRDVLLEILNEMASAVNSFWNFQIIEQQIGDSVELQIIDENWTGYRDSSKPVRTFAHSGAASVFLEANLDIDIPSEMTNQIILKRESITYNTKTKKPESGKMYSVNPDSKNIDVGGLFSNKKDKFLSAIDVDSINSENSKEKLAKTKPDPNKVAFEVDPQTKTEAETYYDTIEQTLVKSDTGIIPNVNDPLGSYTQFIGWRNAKGELVMEVDLSQSAGRSLGEWLGILDPRETVYYEATPEGARLKYLADKIKTLKDIELDTQATTLTTNLDKINIVPNPDVNIIVPAVLGNLNNNFTEFNKNFKIYCCDDPQLFDIIKNEAFESYPGAMKTSHLLPIKYSFKIFGKSGIRRGDTFVIKGIPEKYEKNGFFQVVQVEHDIQDSKWVTEVVGQYRQQVSK
jgi:hypothetical protein